MPSKFHQFWTWLQRRLSGFSWKKRKARTHDSVNQIDFSHTPSSDWIYLKRVLALKYYMMYSFLESCSILGRSCQAGDLSVDPEEIFTEKKDTWCYVSMCKTPHTALPWVNKSSKHFDNLALRHFVKATDVLKTQAHTRYCWLPYSTDSCDLDLFHDKYQWEIWKSTAWKLFSTAPTHLTAKKR